MMNGKDVVIENSGKGILVLAKANATASMKLPGSSKVVVIAQKGSEIEILDNPGRPSESISVFAGKNSHIKFFSTGGKASTRNAEIESNASVDWADTIVGNAKIRITSRLNGTGSRTSITSAFFGSCNELEIDAEAIHNSPNTASSITIRGALARDSKALIRPRIKINGNAAGSEGKQKADVLLLDKDCKATAIPKLEMGTSDIKAAHSVSIGQLDRKKLFYLMSRGLSEEEAVKIAVGGFFEPLLKEMGLLGEETRQAIYAKVDGSKC